MTDSQNLKPAKADSPASSTEAGGSDSSSMQIASFGGEFYIDPAKPLKQFDQGPVKAYSASGTTDVSSVTHYAMVCEPHLTPRTRSAAAFASIINSNLARLVASGPAYWPPARSERYLLIYEMFAGRPLTADGQFRGLGWKSDLVQVSVIKPLVFALQDMRDTDLVHGNISPANIFVTGIGDSVDRIMLGECLSTPPSYTHPVLFETIDRSMADPIARGTPTPDSDLYSLGATLAVILRTRDPMEGLTDEEIVRYKIEHGSYAAMTGKDRFSAALLELLRGLLQDDRSQRWTLEDVVNWLDGQHLTPKQQAKRVRAARPIHFLEERYLRPSLLAMDLNKNQSEGALLIESGNLEQWVERSLEDTALLTRLEAAIETTAELGRGPGYWDRLLCRVSIALDPEAPIRYKGHSLNPDGIAYALTEAMIRKLDLQPYLDLINQQAVMFWLNAQVDTQVDVGSLASRFDNCRAFMRQQNIAYGVERCLYFLNPECNCLSDKLKGFYIRSPEDMMNAFEKISSRSNRPELFLDRHIIAFISVKDRRDIDSYFADLNATEPYRKILGNIKVLATIQQRSRMEKFPGICRWISQIIDPVYERMHDRDLRKSMKVKVNQLVEGGDIAKILSLIENPATLRRDSEAYNKARADYNALRMEDERLEEKLADPSLFGKGVGREVASLTACILSGIVILFFLFMFFTKGSAL